MFEEITFQHGEILFREGEESDFAYLIVHGQVEIFKRVEQGTVLLSSIGRGELVGEMGLISGQPRSASAAAEGPVLAKKITREALGHLLSNSPPEVSQMLRALMERLRESNQKISRLVNKQSQFQLQAQTPPTIKRLTLIPLSNTLKESMGKGIVVNPPFRVGSKVSDGFSTHLDMNDLAIKGSDESILSPNHFTVQRNAQGIEVLDRGSRLGTIVNDTPIGSAFGADTAPLTPGDNTIIAGDISSPYRFCLQWESD